MWYVIVNPTANNGKAKKVIPTIRAAFEEVNLPYELVVTEYKWHCAELAQEAIENGFRKIVTVGGDGTGHEAVNGIFNQDVVPTSEISFCAIPIGTGNDWVRTYNLPKDIKESVAILKKEKTCYQDIGLVHYKNDKGRSAQRYFYNVAGFGYDAYITRVSNRERGIKFSASLYYYTLILRCLFEYKPKKARLILEDEQVIDDTYYTINVGLCKYSGGGMQLTPHALPDDGLFAISTVEKMSKLNVILSTPYLYNNIHKHPKGHLYKARKIRVEELGEGETLLELDGEYVGATTVEFSILDATLKVVIP